MLLPIGALGLEQAREVEELPVPGAVEQPEDAHELVGPAIGRPLVQGTCATLGQVMSEVALHQGDHPEVSRGFLILGEDLQHHHVRPPVGVLRRPDPAFG